MPYGSPSVHLVPARVHVAGTGIGGRFCLCYSPNCQKNTDLARTKDDDTLKLIIEEDTGFQETVIRITCPVMTRELEEIISLIRLHAFSVAARKDGETHLLRLDDICYFESVDGRTFVYTETDVYETDLRLYQLEEELRKTNFLRASKSVLLNLSHLRSVKPQANGRMCGTLDNDEQIIISRKYVAGLKQKLGL